MSQIEYILPLDQPLAHRRLLPELQAALASASYSQLRVLVAYAKSGPLIRMKHELLAWRAAGKSAEMILGVDQRGTSRQALELAVELFDRVYVTQEKGITFHPKMYLFEGLSEAKSFVGSNNLTVGGTETNFEAAVVLTCALPEDIADVQPLREAWDSLLPVQCPATSEVDNELLAELISTGRVRNEAAMFAGGAAGGGWGGGYVSTRSGLPVKPASPLPRAAMRQSAVQAIGAMTGTAAVAAATPRPITGQRFALQVRQRANGEIHLSVTAALQDPSFFKWPFTGQTTPKKASNAAYPQLVPDPIVNFEVWGNLPTPLFEQHGYALNTVYYASRKEIRITASPLKPYLVEYSVMVIEKGTNNVDYEITVYRPDSPHYSAWVASLNQTMPGGGKIPRKFGWF